MGHAIGRRNGAGQEIRARLELYRGIGFTTRSRGVEAAYLSGPDREGAMTSLQRLDEVGRGLVVVDPQQPDVMELFPLVHQLYSHCAGGRPVGGLEV